MSSAIGPPVPAVATLGGELRQGLPPALVEALERIGNQIEVGISGPLACADSEEELAETFQRLFPEFRDYYLSTLLVIWGVLQGDAQRFSALAIRSFREPEDLIRSHGPRWIGRTLPITHCTD